MDLKWVIAARHGDYDEMAKDENLTPVGHEQAKSLAKLVKERTNGNTSVVIFTSPEIRCIETGAHFAEQLGTNADVVRKLCRDQYEDGDEQMEAVFTALSDSSVDVIVLVTHYKAPSGIMNAFSNKFCSTSFPEKIVTRGTALILDVTNGDVQQIP